MAGLAKASTTEFGPTDEPIVGLITEWMSEEGLQKREAGGDLGGTMRLGAYPAKLTGNSVVASIYENEYISEQIGRASCRARVCQHVEISVVDGSLKNKRIVLAVIITETK